MSADIAIVRVFTDDSILTLGNPAGVFIACSLPSEEKMQFIANKAAQPMTAFIALRGTQENTFDIRYYDLGGRVCHICGHATLAATACLARRSLRERRKKLSLLS